MSSVTNRWVNHVLNAQYQGKVESLDIFFDISDVRSFNQFQEIVVENLDLVTAG